MSIERRGYGPQMQCQASQSPGTALLERPGSRKRQDSGTFSSDHSLPADWLKADQGDVSQHNQVIQVLFQVRECDYSCMACNRHSSGIVYLYAEWRRDNCSSRLIVSARACDTLLLTCCALEHISRVTPDTCCPCVQALLRWLDGLTEELEAAEAKAIESELQRTVETALRKQAEHSASDGPARRDQKSRHASRSRQG